VIAPEPYEYELFGEKTCSACGAKLPACRDFFPPNKSAPDGLYRKCRDCKNLGARKRYQANPEKHIAADRARRALSKVAS
jgi:hypothetical protein